MTRRIDNRQKRENRKQGNNNQEIVDPKPDDNIDYKPAAKGPIETLSNTQSFHKDALMHDDMVVAIGSAGTGKTWLATAVAADLYANHQFKKIIMTRPNVEVGKSLGYLPGDKEEKYAPYLEPFKKGLIDRLGSNKFKCDFNRRLIATPLQFMRGETFDDCIMLLDEAQNTTVKDMKMFLTRAGINTKIFITGDVNQTDLNTTETGLTWLVRQIEARNRRFEIIRYIRADCVRSGLCKELLELVEDEV